MDHHQLPSFKADPAKHGCRSDTVIALNFDEKTVLIGNTAYAGENKKSVFTILNYILPGKGVMAMHCSANHAIGNPVDAAVFFGLSGTGKTTLSASPDRTLIGDDEHGWSDRGIFNFEGGCYAKTINLDPKAEPEIYATTSRFGTVIENMVYRSRDAGTGLRRQQPDRQHPLRLSAGGDLERLGHGAGRAPQACRDADLRRVRRAAAHRAAVAGAGDVSFPVGLHLQGRRAPSAG